jgi:hypothetical protein
MQTEFLERIRSPNFPHMHRLHKVRQSAWISVECLNDIELNA